MAYPTTDRHKILESSVAEQSYQIDRGLPVKDTTFHGIINAIVNDASVGASPTYCYLEVYPFPPENPPQAGHLVFEELGDDPIDSLPDTSQYVKVYVLNLPIEAVQAYYQVGQIITYWRYSGQTSQTLHIRGSYVTFWCDHGQHIVKITSVGTSPAYGGAVYNGKRMTQVGSLNVATDPLSMPFLDASMPVAEDCIIVNLAENGQAGSHWIPLPTWTIGLSVAVSQKVNYDANGLPVIAVYIPQAVPVVYLGTSYGDASGVYSNSNLVTGNASGFPPGGMTVGSTVVKVYNEVEKGLSADGNPVHMIPSGTCWPAAPIGVNGSGVSLYLISAPIPTTEVALTTDGGSNGTVSGGYIVNATYTYTVKSLNGMTTYMTAASPTWTRPQGILTGPATHGQIYFDSSGNMQLGWTDEQMAVVYCGYSA